MVWQARLATTTFLLLGTALTPRPSPAQEGAPARQESEALRVFLDCNARNCDSRYFRTEIRFVNWVRDRTDADVHVIMTSESVGGGGAEYRFDFIGLRALEGRDDRHRWTSDRTDTEAEVLEGLTHVFRLGLVRYAALLGLGDRLDVTLREATEGPEEGVAVDPGDDPWDYWVFELEARGSVSGEEQQNFRSLFVSGSANRTTESWRLDLDLNGGWRRSEYQLSDTSTFVDKTSDWGVDALAVKSIASHWSAGAIARGSSSTRFNKDLSFELRPALEWSYYPYPEATRRQLVALYSIGAEWVRWEEETIYLQTRQTIFDQALLVSFEQRQPWGNAEVYAEGSHFLDDLSKWETSLGLEIEYRIFRGLEASVDGGVSWIRNQIHLPAEGASLEEILLQRRALATDHEYFLRFGLSYSFGSIYNNVVNNRFTAGRF